MARRLGLPRAVVALRLAARRPAEPGGAAAADFRAFMCTFPSGVAVVTAEDTGGRPFGMTCSSVSCVAMSPPTLLV